MQIRTGVDLGGTKIEAVVLDRNDHILARGRCSTPTNDYSATIQAIADLVETIEGDAGAVAGHIGVGGPGSPSPTTGLQRNANSTILNGRPLAADLCAALGRRVTLANDADCLALSEAHDGAAAAYRSRSSSWHCAAGQLLARGCQGRPRRCGLRLPRHHLRWFLRGQQWLEWLRNSRSWGCCNGHERECGRCGQVPQPRFLYRQDPRQFVSACQDGTNTHLWLTTRSFIRCRVCLDRMTSGLC